MGKLLEKKHADLREKMREYDEAILRLLKQGHRKLITQIIKDYLSLHE